MSLFIADVRKGEPMSDLIDRQAILKHIEKIRQSALMMDDTRRAGIIMQGMHLCEKAARNQPSAQSEKRTEERTETHSCDLIDRQAAIDAIYHHFPSVSRTRARTMLHEVPSAQPERKRGRWIRNDNGTYSCSLCHSWIPEEQYYYARFCLYCGADMRGEDDG